MKFLKAQKIRNLDQMSRNDFRSRSFYCSKLYYLHENNQNFCPNIRLFHLPRSYQETYFLEYLQNLFFCEGCGLWMKELQNVALVMNLKKIGSLKSPRLGLSTLLNSQKLNTIKQIETITL